MPATLKRVLYGAPMFAPTVTMLRGILRGAPADPGRIAADLTGWEHDSCLFVCATCAGRIMSRGCSHVFNTGWHPIYDGVDNSWQCATCA